MLTVRLLGQFNIQYEDTPILLPSRPAQSLLARLVLTAGIAHRREKLAGDQWPDANEANALSNLRHALWRIRSGLKRAGADPDNYITADDLVIRFNADAAYWVDALVVEQDSKRATATINDLMQAAALHQGELLPGFYDEGDEWATPFRSRLTMAFDRLMARLIKHLNDDARWPQIVEMSRHWVAHGESQEHAYRELMLAHYALDDLAGVRADYRDCTDYLRIELGAEPSSQARALFEQLVSGTYPKTPSRNSATPAPSPAPPSTTESPPNNLPQQVTPFVGRGGDLKDIAALLTRPNCRLITLLGPGGVGKTRLAIKAASAALKDMAEAFSDGVYLARLDAATTGEALLTALADAVRHVPFGQEHPKTQLLNFLREKKMLLVLDNFEQLLRDDVDGASLVDEVLATAQHVKALVTSRERLHLPSEHLVEVDGLDYPDDADIAADDNDLMRFGAVQLFLQAAQRILSRFSFQVEKASVARICRLTQGMPLALELAAAWVRALSCREIAARIEHNLDVLAATEPDLSDRHRSVRAVLNYSWQLLSPQERNAFAALSVFRAGFELDAAEDVARTSVAMLYALVDKSLLRRSPAGRYEMHDLVRRYGEEKLDASEDEDYSPNTVHARMARYFLQFAQAHGKDYPALEPEWANFLAAMRAAHERYEWTAVTHMAQALLDAWFTRARFSDAREGLKMASEAAAADDDLTTLATVLRWRGRACIEQGNYDEAEQYLRTGLQFCEQIGNELDAARYKYELARVYVERSNHAEAEHLFIESSTLMKHSDARSDYASAIFSLAWLYFQRQKYADALPLCEQALEIQQHVDDKRACIPTLNLLALLSGLSQDIDPTDALRIAEDYCRQAHELAETLLNQGELAMVFYTMSQVERRGGKLTQAREHAHEGLKLLKQMGDRKNQAHSLFQLSWVDAELGGHQSALEEAQHSLTLYRVLGDEWAIVRLMLHTGDVLARLNCPADARAAWQEGLELAARLDHPSALALRERLDGATDPKGL